MKRKQEQADIVTSMRCFIAAMFTVLISAVVESAIVRGPINIVGIHHENVTLHCRSDEGLKVTWKFTPIGQSGDGVDIFGHHGTSWSSRGDHSLTLERVTFDNAGKYECRLVGSSSGGIDAAIAYVVVVADPPRCTNNLAGRLAHGDPIRMECSVTFIGQHKLTLEWIAPNGTVILRKDYMSGNVTHVARHRVNVAVQSFSRYNASMPGFMCRAFFSNLTSQFKDQASNAPEFRRNTCMVRLPSSFSTTDTPTSSRPPQSAGTIPLTIVIIFLVFLLEAAFVIYFYFKKLRIEHQQSPNHNATRGFGHQAQPPRNIRCENNKGRGDDKTDDSSEATNGPVATQVSEALNSITVQSEPERQPLLTSADIHTSEAAAAETTAAPSVPEGDNRPISNGRSEPETNVTSVHGNANADVPTSDISTQESTVNSPDSTNSIDVDSDAAGHNEEFIALHEDPPSLIAQANDERVAEDEVDQSNT